MRPSGPNLVRRADLEAAIKRANPRDVISLQGLADAWGTSKSNFTNTLRLIERQFEMPPYTPGPQGVHMYPAKKALRVLLAYETRNDKQSLSLQARTNAILGKGKKKPTPEEAMLPINEMAIASRVMAETEERERQQGLHVPIEDVARTATDVFAMVSGFLSELDTYVDPNGVLDPEVRALIKSGGHKTSLEIHAQMKDMLSGNAIPQPERPKRSRSPHGRAGRARPRRKSR